MAQVVQRTTQTAPPPKTRVPTVVGHHQVDNAFHLTTPENISFQYRLAGPFRRLFPYLLDLLIVGAVFAIVTFAISLLFLFLTPIMMSIGLGVVVDFFASIAMVIVMIGGFSLYWFYGAYCEAKYNGRTIGKLSAGIRVLSVDGHAIDGVQATLRNFFRTIDLMPFVPLSTLLETTDISFFPIPTALIGLFVMSISPRFQRLGDMVAGTMVVIQEPEMKPHIETFQDPRVAGLAELIPDTFYVSNSLGRTIAEYVHKRNQLGPSRANEIASKLATHLKQEFELPIDTDSDLLICSLYYKVFVGSASQDAAAEPDRLGHHDQTTDLSI